MNSKLSQETGLIAWFAKNHATVNVLMAFIIIAGIVSLGSFVREIFPTIDPKTITISVIYPGATPQDVEDSITRRVEEALIGIQGIDRIDSAASEGYGLITAKLEDFADSDQVLSDIETEVSSLSNFPPENAEEVHIVKTKATGQVMSLVVYGTVNEKALRDWAEIIEDGLLQLPNVSLVNISGAKSREISIEISEEKLREYGLTLNDVAAQIRNFSLDIPGGTLKSKGAEILMRVKDKKYYGSEFENITIKSNTNGSLLKLSDLAMIKDGFADDKLLSTYNNQNAVFLDINRSASQDTIKIDQEIKNYIQNLQLPEGVNLAIWKNRTEILKDRMSLLARNAVLGLALVFLSLVLFLDLKLAFWTSMGIAISFAGGLFLASLFGLTLNMISLFALIIVLGIVVDDAIVIGESIFTEQEDGKKDLEATLTGVRKVISPVTIGVLTTVAAFSPLLFSTGMLGQILRPVPLIVIGILLTSLLEAYFILPAHLSSSSRWSTGIVQDIRNKVSGYMNKFVEKFLLPLAVKAFHYKLRTLAIVFASIIFAFLLFGTGAIKFVFFPQIESDEISVSLEMPVGTPFETTQKNIYKILAAGKIMQAEFNKINTKKYGNEIFKNVAVLVGGKRIEARGSHGGESSTNASHLAQIDVQLVPSSKRKFSAFEIEKRWQKLTGEIPGAIKVAFASSLVRGEEDINIQLSHRDEKVLEEAGEILKNKMKTIPHVYEVVDSYEFGKLEFIYKLNNIGLASGVTPSELGRYLRSAFNGIEIDRIQRGRNEIKVMLRYPEDQRKSLAILQKMQIQLANGKRMAINDITERINSRSPASIKRVNGRRVVQVTADVDESKATPDEIISQIFKNIIPELEQRYPGLSASLEGRSKERQDDLANLLKNMGIAILLIFVLLTGQLKSYYKPLVIIMTIPLGIAGAIYAHLILGYGLSFISLFGMVALTGVVVNDSVVLVDYYNELRERGIKPYEAALTSIERRFRPILLTTLTTSLGLLPMLLETSLQARFIVPMAISLAGGILFSSSVLIIFIPTLLLACEGCKGKLNT